MAAPKSPLEMANAIIANLHKNFGKTYEDFAVEFESNGLTTEEAIKDYLKAQGLGSNQAWVVAEKYLGIFEYADEANLLEQLFAPFPKELKELYDGLHLEIVKQFAEVKVSYCKTYVPYSNRRQFMVIRPCKKGLEIGFALPEDTNHELLLPSKNFGVGERVKHKLIINSALEITIALRFAQIGWENN
jgi:predicted transport protein